MRSEKSADHLRDSEDRAVPVRVTVYDVAGREVARPIADELLLGRVTRAWQPVGLPSGVYFVRANLGGHEQIRKMVWIRIGADLFAYLDSVPVRSGATG